MLMKWCLGLAALNLAVAQGAVNPYPWEETRTDIKPETERKLPEIPELKWADCGGPEGKAKVLADKTIEWTVKVDHFGGGGNGVGWPAFEAWPKPGLDLRDKGVLAFEVRALRDIGRVQPANLILRTEKDFVMTPFHAVPGEWRTVTVKLGNAAWLKDVRRLHVFLSESEYAHGSEVVFQFRNFRTGVAGERKISLAPGSAGASLWLGDRADQDDRLVRATTAAKTLPAVLHMENRLGRPIPAHAEVRFRLRDLFTMKDVTRRAPLGRAVADGARERIALTLDAAGLEPGYYHVLADVCVDGRSVLGTRKGSDEFYLASPQENESFSMLSIRCGMAYWTIDRIHGGSMHTVRAALPHAYDPFDAHPAAYREFLARHALSTRKVCEGYEAGMPGFAIAAEAFRRAGSSARAAFAEAMLVDSAEAMLKMQDACGGVVTESNELGTKGIGTLGGDNARNCFYNCDQMAEWMRGLCYATLYFHRKGGAEATVKRLNAACLKAGRFLFANCREDSDGVPNVIRNYNLRMTSPGKVTRTAYHQEGRRCDVYQPRILAGLSFTAATLIACGEMSLVPEDWWGAFDASVKWMAAKMRPNGLFDGQCGDVTEGGCHTFLGNIYAGEGLFGAALADRLAGRAEESAAALAAAHRAYRYVTDDCWIRGHRFQYPLEFWVGPYVYWLFTEWERHVGAEPVFRDWIETLDRKWSQERKWGDFVRMPGMDCGRTKSNGMLANAILAYPGLKLMDEIGRPWKLLDDDGVARR